MISSSSLKKKVATGVGQVSKNLNRVQACDSNLESKCPDYGQKYCARNCLGKDKIIWNTQDMEFTTTVSEPYIQNKLKNLTCCEERLGKQSLEIICDYHPQQDFEANVF